MIRSSRPSAPPPSPAFAPPRRDARTRAAPPLAPSVRVKAATQPSPTPTSAASAPQTGLGRSMELLGKVKAGTLPGDLLAPGDRQLLVILLSADGLSTAEIAQILKVSDRSVERDRRAIREGSAIPKDPKLVGQMVGRLMAEAELSVQRIRRVARERDVDPSVKVDAEHRCFQIVRDLVQSLQRVGYIPTVSQKVEADLTHHLGELPTLGDLQLEIDRLKLVGGEESGAFVEVESVVARAAAATCVKQLATAINENGGSHDHGDEH